MAESHLNLASALYQNLRGISTIRINAKVHIALLMVLLFFGTCLSSIAAPFYPSRAMRRGYSETMAGLVLSMNPLFALITYCILAIVMFKLGIKFLLCAGIFMAGVSASLFGIVDFCPANNSYLILSFCTCIIEGVGTAMYFTAIYTLTAILFPKTYAVVIGLLEASLSMGSLLGPIIGGALNEAVGYFLPFVVLGAALLLLDLLVFFLAPNSIDKVASENVKTLTVLWKMMCPTTVITVYTLSASTMSLAFVGITLGVRLEHFGISDPILVGAVYLSSTGAFAFSAPLSGRFADRVNNTWLLISIASLMLCIGNLIIGPTPLCQRSSCIPAGLPQLIVGCICIHASLATVVVSSAKELQRQAGANGLDPNNKSTCSVIALIFESTWCLGFFIGSLISSIMVENLGFEWAATVHAGFVAIALPVQLWIVVSFQLKRRDYESHIDEIDDVSEDRL